MNLSFKFYNIDSITASWCGQWYGFIWWTLLFGLWLLVWPGVLSRINATSQKKYFLYPGRISSRSHQFVLHYPRSYRRVTTAGITAMAGQSHRMRCEIWTNIITCVCFACLFVNFFFSLLAYQGIYSHTVDPVQRRGNSQPDLLNVKAQKDTLGKQSMEKVLLIQRPAD